MPLLRNDSAIIYLRVKRSRRVQGEEMIRVGLIGYGLAGAVFHEPLIQACNRLELAAVLTSREHPVRVSTLDELLERSDLVVIASPNQSHFPLAKAAVESRR